MSKDQELNSRAVALKQMTAERHAVEARKLLARAEAALGTGRDDSETYLRAGVHMLMALHKQQQQEKDG